MVCVSRGRCAGNSRRALGALGAGVDGVGSTKAVARRASSASSSSTHSSKLLDLLLALFSLRRPYCRRRNLEDLQLEALDQQRDGENLRVFGD